MLQGFFAYWIGLAQLTLAPRGTQGRYARLGKPELLLGSHQQEPFSGIFKGYSRDSSHTLAHHSSSACRDLWGCWYFPGPSNNKVLLGAAHVGKWTQRNRGYPAAL